MTIKLAMSAEVVNVRAGVDFALDDDRLIIVNEAGEQIAVFNRDQWSYVQFTDETKRWEPMSLADYRSLDPKKD
jgi:hypothetical protein